MECYCVSPVVTNRYKRISLFTTILEQGNFFPFHNEIVNGELSCTNPYCNANSTKNKVQMNDLLKIHETYFPDNRIYVFLGPKALSLQM